MKNSFDLTYLSIDSIQEGVGASQIVPLICGLSRNGIKTSLVSFEKKEPDLQFRKALRDAGVTWSFLDFGKYGAIAGLDRIRRLQKNIPQSLVLHGRSDMATFASITSREIAPTLWDVRSLWADQRSIINNSGIIDPIRSIARLLEKKCASGSVGLSTLTSAVVPVLERRNGQLPEIREVIPTCVDLNLFAKKNMPTGELKCLLSGTFNGFYDLKRTREVIFEIRKRTKMQVIWARPMESQVQQLNVGEDLIISATYVNMPKIIADSHFGIAICKEDIGESLSASSPTKIGEFLSVGRPVIVSAGLGDLDNLLARYNAGVVLSRNNLNIWDNLIDLITDSETVSNCRRLAEDEYNMEVAIQKYMKLYIKIME